MNEIDAYIFSFPIDVQEKLTTIRSIIREEAPQATERYDLNGK